MIIDSPGLQTQQFPVRIPIKIPEELNEAKSKKKLMLHFIRKDFQFQRFCKKKIVAIFWHDLSVLFFQNEKTETTPLPSSVAALRLA